MWKASLGSSPELALLDGGKTETLVSLIRDYRDYLILGLFGATLQNTH